jgi:hypothetical protein
MGSTNKTQYLELPQWIGTDQPTWLGDMNDAFLKIDKGYNTISGNASSAISQAGQAVQTATNAKTAATNAEEEAENAKNIADTAQNTAQSALTTANTALSNANNAVEGLQLKVNLTDLTNWVTLATTIPQATTASEITVLYNPTLKMLNIFGRLLASAAAFTGPTIFRITNLPFTITQNRNIYGGFFRTTSGNTDVLPVILTTNGSVNVNTTITPNIGKEVSCNVLLNVSTWN